MLYYTESNRTNSYLLKLQPWFLICGGRPAFGQNSLMMMILGLLRIWKRIFTEISARKEICFQEMLDSRIHYATQEAIKFKQCSPVVYSRSFICSLRS